MPVFVYIQGQYFYISVISSEKNISILDNYEKRISNVLSSFHPVQLGDIAGAKLMDRVDTKFVFHKNELPELLKSLKEHYDVLEINGKRKMRYESLYLDGSGLPFYLDHHNRRDHRFKVRYRKYSDSGTTFLEIKEKRKGRTRKTRIEVDDFENNLGPRAIGFVHQFIPRISLKPVLWNTYHRITLVKQSTQERATIDIGLTYHSGDKNKKFANLVIAELKQERIDRKSAFYQLMKLKQIRPFQVSKYCVGMVTMRGLDNIKYNRFKKKVKTINRINNDS